MSAFILTAEIRSTTDRGLAIYQGETHDVVDERTGEIIARDHFVWLPKKLTTILREWRDRDNRRMAEIEIPEWLAKEKELI
ncbi:MAG: hypothetical protein C0519_14045 [Hyphomicrobium sp.]|nr:hypothetical protein [Hyphomicrobium sp.]PPD06273.1 MAG: hypothetical protein CTY28_14400 [Hyphomicrobium sp.]